MANRTTGNAKAALERLRIEASAGKISADNIETLIAYFVEAVLRDAIDRLSETRTRHVFRSKQMEEAKKLLEALL
jgi:hypothetical protein